MPSRKRKARRAGAVPLLAVIAALGLSGGCEGAASPYDELEWICHEDEGSCECIGAAEAVRSQDPRLEVVSCRTELDCCFVKENSDGTTLCTCIDVPAETGSSGAGGGGEGGGQAGAAADELACLAAAVDRGSPEVVRRCPPISLDSAGVCALVYESCDPDYLRSIGVIDCCDGLRCREDSQGFLICEPE